MNVFNHGSYHETPVEWRFHGPHPLEVAMEEWRKAVEDEPELTVAQWLARLQKRHAEGAKG